MNHFDQLRNNLNHLADLNGDGRVTRADVDAAIDIAKESATLQAQRRPITALLIAAALGALIAAALTKAFC